MDIAKIRKKIKEEKQGKEAKEKNQEETPEAGAPPEKQETGQAREEPAENVSEQAENVPDDESSLTETVKKEIPPADVVKPVESTEAVEDIVELLIFNLSNEEFAFRVSDIEEILRFQRITRVPKVPDYVLGISSLRGKIIPVADLKKRLSIKGEEETDYLRKKILILKAPKGPYGVLVDKVRSVIRISPSEIAEPPSHLTETELTYIEGVVLYNNRFISVMRMSMVADIKLN